MPSHSHPPIVTGPLRALGFAISLGLASQCLAGTLKDGIDMPKPTDPQLELRLVASEPEIVTPIGIAVDRRNRLFVVESHTHHRPADYKGPAADLVKVFLDADGDGIPDQSKVFAGGFKSAMNLALAPSDEVYLVHRSGVVLLHDADGDGVSERSTTVLELMTNQDYPHNGLNGITFSHDGWLYLGIGENFSAEYALRGTDGRTLRTGPGRGGKIFRCRFDGRELQEVASGFWNPFGLELDRMGRLFCVDNDPGGRPPCRLLHVVPGGEYGYRRRYEDTHVFNGWDGELPGTLPMLTGTGEAPCGILSADRLALPGAYAGALFVASWGDAAIEMYRLQPQGASFRATKENLVVGKKKLNEAFCPVDLAAAPDGSLYITDWADRTSYPVHNKGRIWRLAAKPGMKVAKPSHANPLVETNAAALRFQHLLAADSLTQFDELKSALADADPFIRSAAITALAKPVFRESVSKCTDDADPMTRLGALISLWRSQISDPVPLLRKHLGDSDERVRFLSLWWAGEDDVKALADELGRAVAKQQTPSSFQAYLAATELLAAETAAPGSKGGVAAKLAVVVRQQLLARILHDDTQPGALHAMAAAAATTLSDTKTAERLLEFALSGDTQLRREAVRTLANCPHPAVPDTLKWLAQDARLPAALRADAILSLTRRDAARLSELTILLNDREPAVQIEIARALRLAAGSETVRKVLREKLTMLGDASSALAEQLRMALQSDDPAFASKRPTSPDAWRQAVAEGGNAESGQRVFLSAQTGCTMCHQAQGRGTSIGPDLSHVARSLDRAQLINAILDPSREIAPQYEHHIVETQSGTTYSGVLVHIGLEGSPLINALGSGRVRIPVAQIKRHVTSPLSMMPFGLENAMTVQDFRDLLAFLQTLK